MPMNGPASKSLSPSSRASGFGPPQPARHFGDDLAGAEVRDEGVVFAFLVNDRDFPGRDQVEAVRLLALLDDRLALFERARDEGVYERRTLFGFDGAQDRARANEIFE